jgi:hypothetical protein
MPDASPAGFVRLLASAVVRDGEPDVLAREAHQALEALFAGQKSLVLDVQFTGFVTPRGQPVGGVSPELLRGAGQLIMLRVSRVGFTPEVREADLEAFFEVAARGPGELGPGGIIAAMRDLAPRGLYLTSSTGETYRPAPAPKPAAEPAPAASAESTAPPPTVESALPSDAPAPTAAGEQSVRVAAAAAPEADVSVPPADEAAGSVDAEPGEGPSNETASTDTASAAADEASSESAESEEPAEAEPPSGDGPPAATRQPTDEATPASALAFDDEEETLAFSDFEVLEAFPDLGRASNAPAAPAGQGGAGQEGGSGDLYHFFRSSAGAPDAEAADLPRLLHSADSLDQFDEVAGAAARTVARMVQTDQHAAALDILEALVGEAERSDRSRVFREGAVQALRRAGTDTALHSFIEYVQRWPEERERVVRFFLFLGGDAVGLLESLLFRTGEPDLRSVLFRRLVAREGVGSRLLARTMSDPAPGRTRAMLELAATSDLDSDIVLKWIGEAATHPDSTVRMDGARHAAAVGGRAGLRVLVDLLGDDERLVKRSAIQGLGTMGDSAAVPFLARLLNDTSDEDVQLAVIAALGRIASPDALPALVGMVNKRQLFTSKKMQRVKAASLGAIGKITGPAARDVLTSVASGKDAELAAEARRILALAD